MSNVYEISTIKDIFDKIPEDRIDTCMNELKVLIKQARAMNELLSAAAESVAEIDESMRIKTEFPTILHWIDDGAGEVTMQYQCGDEHIFTHNVKIGGEK